MKNEKRTGMIELIISMIIMGTVGVFRRGIDLPSGVICMFRGFVGAGILLLGMKLRRESFSPAAIKENLLLLVLSGGVMGVNWILLFEAYNYTSVAVATLCYYMAPVFVVLLSPAVLGEKLTGKRLFCVFLALVGVVLVSGVTETGIGGIGELRGVAFSLVAAVFYAGVILMNKRMKPIPTYDRSIVQLASAGAVMLVYDLFARNLTGLTFTPRTLLMLAIVCFVNTGLAYALYYGSMGKLPAQVLALFSYIDPVVAVLMSALVLREGLTPAAAVGTVLVLAGALLSEMPEKKLGVNR